MMYDFSVIIPTYNRPESLVKVIYALEHQQDAPSFEIIVVDDGSACDTGQDLKQVHVTRALQFIEADHKGPATARNRGISASKSHYLAFLGDDTIPEKDWLYKHAEAHQKRGYKENVAVLGHIEWHPRIKITPFLEYLNESGRQFGFALINDPENVPHTMFYSSNLSLVRTFAGDRPFNERFQDACWEDIELGYRLQKKGLNLVYEKKAIVYHDHPTSLKKFRQRFERVGYSAVIFYQLHPEVDYLGLTPSGPVPLPSKSAHLYRSILVQLSTLLPLKIPPVWEGYLRYFMIKGIHRGWDTSLMADKKFQFGKK
ncbi:glycosyltransferase family 2 protein [candidate division CSSED10-310 bacterium]|uniref:Glycosyltransferase family 2 protein n=1 Tax=candidate division CSSED10-310 bacterium TaxID=2855610 RepID=A0ABV6YRC1_UNCC1